MVETETCELYPLARAHDRPCGIRATTVEHIIPRQAFRGNPEGLRLAEEEYPDIFLGRTCLICNAVTKFADTKRAKLFLLRKRMDLPGFDEALEAVAETFTAPPEYLRREYLEQSPEMTS